MSASGEHVNISDVNIWYRENVIKKQHISTMQYAIRGGGWRGYIVVFFNTLSEFEAAWAFG